MFVVPPHIYDTSIYCKEAEETLIPFALPHVVEAKKDESLLQYTLTPPEHELLCFQLGKNTSDLPLKVKELEALYKKEKTELQHTIDRNLRRQRRRIERATPAKEEDEKDKYEALEDAANIATAQFLFQWKPYLQSATRFTVFQEAWTRGLEEYKANVTDEIAMWKELKVKQADRTLLLTVTFRDRNEQQVQTFQVLNTMRVSDFIRTVQRQFGISTLVGEELRLFCVQGPLQSTASLNQYESDKITHLKLFRILQEVSDSAFE